MSTPIYWPILALAFVLEVGALAAFAVWGLHAGNRTSSSLAWAVGAPMACALMWGLFASPRAPFDGPVLTPVVTVIFFASAAMALYVSGHPRLAAGFSSLSLSTSCCCERCQPTRTSQNAPTGQRKRMRRSRNPNGSSPATLTTTPTIKKLRPHGSPRCRAIHRASR